MTAVADSRFGGLTPTIHPACIQARIKTYGGAASQEYPGCASSAVQRQKYSDFVCALRIYGNRKQSC